MIRSETGTNGVVYLIDGPLSGETPADTSRAGKTRLGRPVGTARALRCDR